jgi:hypothetical protein
MRAAHRTWSTRFMKLQTGSSDAEIQAKKFNKGSQWFQR